MVIKNDGNVGIGATSPDQKLEVQGNIRLGTGGTIYGDTNNPSLSLNNSNGTFLRYTTSHYVGIGSGVIRLVTGGSDRLYINSSGNVGIGTTSPTGLINVEGINGTWRVNRYGNMLFNNTTDTGNLWTVHPRSNGYLSFGYSAATNLSGTSQDEYFSTAYDLMTIEGPSGNVGIGTTSPSSMLNVNTTCLLYTSDAADE